jgi:hypothetical protein
MRTTVYTPLGLITSTNKHGHYPDGALSRAINVCMRRPGTIEPVPARVTWASNAADSSTVDRMWAGDANVLVYSVSGGLFWVNASGRTGVLPYGGWLLSAAYARFMRARGRHFVGSTGGPLVLDSESDSSARPAGMAAPHSIAIQSIPGVAGDQALANNTNANYTVIVLRRQSDGYTVASAPSNVLRVKTNSGATIAVQIGVRWTTVHTYLAGDIIELYRTPSQAVSTEPGAQFRLCGSHTITSAEATALFATVTDNTADAALGADLYANPGQPSQSARPNRTPSLTRDMAMFKGYAFYVTTHSHVRGVFKLRGSVGVLGSVAATRIHGIGRRQQSGDFTNGSPTVTNVTDVSGLKIGQEISDSDTGGTSINPGTTITNIVGTTITMSANATSTMAANIFNAFDRIEIGGVVYRFDDVRVLNGNLSAADVPVLVRSSASMEQEANFGGFVGGRSDGLTTLLAEVPFYRATGATALTFRATNGQNYVPPLESLTGAVYTYPITARYNLLTVSKFDQPEHVPSENELPVGSGVIYRLITTKDALFAFCSDGLYRITGDAGVFRVDLVDEKLRLASSSAVDTMQNRVWAYTNRGLVRIGPGGVEAEISDARVKDLLPGATLDPSTDAATGSYATFLTCDPQNREVRLCLRVGTTSTIYLYNTLTDAFTTIVDATTSDVRSEVFAPFENGILWTATGSGATRPIYEYSSSAYRTDYDVRFQPVTGDKNAFSLKQWSDFDFLFIDSPDAARTLIPTINGSALGSAISSTDHNGDRRFVSGVTLDSGISHMLQVGFTPGTDAGQGWRLSGTSLRWTPMRVGDQVQK